MIKTAKGKKTGTVKVTFALPGDVGPVSVVGDFNEWDPDVHPLRKRSNGTRSASVELPKDEEFCFKYLKDGGVWMNDPEADTVHRDGTENSVVRT